jgi:periplasmic protein TonB
MPPPSAGVGVVGGVPGGVPGGGWRRARRHHRFGSHSGSSTSSSSSGEKPKTPAQDSCGRLGAGSQDGAQDHAQYPPLAKQARIQGVVRLNAIIGRDGSIQNLQVVSGHPLLAPAAIDAVKRWVYQPTLLNGEPVEVVTVIDVNFTLSQ